MLSFGLKMRFSVQLFVTAFHLLTSMVIDGHICAAAFPGVRAALCVPGMAAYQAVACFALPLSLVWVMEHRSRRSFLQTVA